MPDLLRDNMVNILWIAGMATIAIVAVPILRNWLRTAEGDHDDLLIVLERGQKAFIAVVVVAAARIALFGVDDADSPLLETGLRVTAILFIAAVVWLIVEVLLAIEVVILGRYAPLDQIAEVDVRKRRTQIILIRRLIVAVAITIGIGAVLMTFPAIRVIGQGVLASAGIISIIAGLAAQSTLTNVFAGIQLTLTNAMRVGDVVSVEGQSGTVGEITLTYVVVYLWDDRRLILPSSYFTTNPYENWTRRGGRINGVIEFDVDWSVPLDVLREELDRVLHESPLWDGRAGRLIVFDVTQGRVRLRIIASAATTDDMFALSSHVREAMVRFVAAQGYQWVPRMREEDVPSASDPAR
jgi:small-conductance mechanosensitive channel